MAQDITLNVDGMLINWLKEAGDSVKEGEVIAEFEADKATVEVVAPADGVLTELIAEVGDEYNEGDVIARLGAGDEAPAQAPDASTKDEDTSDEDASDKDTADTADETDASAENGASRTSDGRIKASPLAKRVAQDKGVDLSRVSGTGPGGRIVKEDVENYKPSQPKPAKKSEDAPATEGVTIGQSYGKLPQGDDVEVIDLSRMRRAIAKGTITSFQTTPHFYVLVECDVEPLMKLRKQLNASLEDEGIKVSVNDLIVKAVALTLKKFPNLNSHYYGDKRVQHKRINVAIAVALMGDDENGLVNVVSPDADKVALSAMATYHKQMFDDVRDGRIKPEYVRDGTFLVSNLGAYGVESFSSIIDPPQSGALAVGAARRVPIVLEDGTLGVGTRMKVSLSIDHRISDGAEGAQFLNHFRELIENPMRLLA